MKSIILCLVFVLAYAGGQRITTIQLDGVQYFISRMNPYSPELNYFLAYQYCRSLGLQLASFETKEKVESMTEYLQNAGYGKYNFWTSGNRLGTGMFLWMSTGLPFNATFDYFEKSPETVGMDPLDHNSNTSPQRTARDSSSGLQKGCVHLKAPSLRWAPEDCSAVKDFICEQTRCYYYNYGSIPVSSAQGRPIQTSTSTSLYTTLAATTTTTTTSTTTEPPTTPAEARQFSTISTVMPAQLTAEHTSPLAALLNGDILDQDRTSARPAMQQQQHDNDAEEEHDEELEHDQEDDEQHHELEEEDDEVNVVGRSSSSANAVAAEEDEVEQEEEEHEHEDEHEQDESDDEDEQAAELHHQQALAAGQDAVGSVLPEDIPVEQKLKQITKEIEQLSGGTGDRELRLDSRQSFLSLSDLIKNIRPAEKVVPQIDSSYANTMRVLGEPLSQRR
ncbi:myotubularin-related protein DDB_G0290005 isoform X1 [Anopheles gambiae]|uniref:myotubularin-related protein DDB_G0290005 isoform X1 n=1 Tax=Anopheles gambiae TaxID=7165 RepID=UPI002AC94694|nr:myotubularin-related protein DDB_G0290005 isoform X1 [Anopheles gambiae]